MPATRYCLFASVNARRRTMAAFRSKFACMCIHSCGVVLKSCARRRAVSAVTPRLPRTSSFSAHRGHPERLGGCRLGHLERPQELLEQDIARVNGWPRAGGTSAGCCQW